MGGGWKSTFSFFEQDKRILINSPTFCTLQMFSSIIELVFPLFVITALSNNERSSIFPQNSTHNPRELLFFLKKSKLVKIKIGITCTLFTTFALHLWQRIHDCCAISFAVRTNGTYMCIPCHFPVPVHPLKSTRSPFRLLASPRSPAFCCLTPVRR